MLYSIQNQNRTPQAKTAAIVKTPCCLAQKLDTTAPITTGPQMTGTNHLQNTPLHKLGMRHKLYLGLLVTLTKIGNFQKPVHISACFIPIFTRARIRESCPISRTKNPHGYKACVPHVGREEDRSGQLWGAPQKGSVLLRSERQGLHRLGHDICRRYTEGVRHGLQRGMIGGSQGVPLHFGDPFQVVTAKKSRLPTDRGSQPLLVMLAQKANLSSPPSPPCPACI